MLKSIYTMFEWSCGKVGYDGLLDLSMDFVGFKIFFAAFSISSLFIIMNLMISTINDAFVDVRENELYWYDKELVDYAAGMFDDAKKMITGNYDDEDGEEEEDEERKKVKIVDLDEKENPCADFESMVNRLSAYVDGKARHWEKINDDHDETTNDKQGLLKDNP